MRHRQTTATLGRSPAHRKAMLRNMVTDLLRHEKIQTTAAKAKVLRPLAERMITLGKRESLHARRHAARVIRDKDVLRKLFDDLAPRYAERPGGYTRITKLATRPGDRADMAVIEFVEAELKQRKRKRKKKTGPRTASQDTVAAVPTETVVESDDDAAAAELAAAESDVAVAESPESEPEVAAADSLESESEPEVAAADSSESDGDVSDDEVAEEPDSAAAGDVDRGASQDDEANADDSSDDDENER